MIYFSSTTLGFYDSGIMPAAEMPPDVVAVSPATYAAVMAAHAAGQVVAADGNGAPITVAPPAPTLAQRAATASGAGLTIALSGSLTLAPTLFPTDAMTQAKLGAVATTIAATGGFPGGASTFPMKDASGAWQVLTVDQYKTVAGAIAAYVAACDLIAEGNPLEAADVPSNSVSLTV